MESLKKTLHRFHAFFRHLTLLNLAQIFLMGFVFCMPFQIQTFLSQDFAYDSGLINPFATFYLTLSDICLLGGLFFLGASIIFEGYNLSPLSRKQKSLNVWIFVLLASLFFSFIISSNLFLSAIDFLRFIEFYIFYLLVSCGVLSFDVLKRVFIVTVFFQASLGLLQYAFQADMGLQFLGEPILNPDIPGIAKLEAGSHVLIRPYGTFVHPNVLAAYLLFAIFLSLFSWKREVPFYTALLVLLVLVFLLTFSRAGWLALFFSLLFYFSVTNRKIPYVYLGLALSILLFFVVTFDVMRIFIDTVLLRTGLEERFVLLDIARAMFYQHPFGIGLGQFTVEMQNYVGVKLMPWDLQPVHNVFLLLLVEGGIVTAFVFFAFFLRIFQQVFNLYKRYKNRLMGGLLLSLWGAILVLGLFDHYLISLYQGQFLLWFFLIMVGNYLSLKEEPILK